MNIIDKAINYFDPAKGLKRLKMRKLQKQMVNYGESNASVNKDLGLWNPTTNTPYEDINVNLDKLRARSRSLYMEGGIATGAIKTLVTNVIGMGLKLKVVLDNEALGISEAEAVEWSKDVERRFEVWANNKDCCVSGLNNFYELQALNYLATLLNGDSFTLISYNENKELELNLIEGDRVSTPDYESIEQISPVIAFREDFVKLKNGNYIESGIEKTPKGKVVAIYVASVVMTDFGEKTEWSRIETRNNMSNLPNVIINFTAERPNQTRGVPFLSPSITLLKQLQEYIKADLETTIINSSLGMIFHLDDMSDNPLAMGALINEEQGDQFETFVEKRDRVSKYQLQRGTVLTLGKDDKVTFADPNKPRLSFESFTGTLTKFIGSCLEIPSEVLLKSFNSSYSASRASLNAHWEIVKNKRMSFISDFCQPIYELWLFQQISTGVIKAPGYLEDKYISKLWSGAMWIGSSLSSIDPVKEVTAAEKRVLNGFSTRSKEAMEMSGTDFFYNAKLLQKENESLSNLNKKTEENTNLEEEL